MYFHGDEEERSPFCRQKDDDGIALQTTCCARLSDARDVAACSSVSRRWREASAFIPSLHFPRKALHGSPADAGIVRMVCAAAAAASLEDFVIHCPFSGSSLASCYALCGRSLRALDLRVDFLDGELDCVGLAKRSESLKLWDPSLICSLDWGLSFGRLRRLETVGVIVLSGHFAGYLIPIRCCSDGALSNELERLLRSKLDHYFTGHSALNRNSPTSIDWI